MAVTPADVATTLGRSAPAEGSPEWDQWELWIGDVDMLICGRFRDRYGLLDPNVVDYVTREAVAARATRPDAASSYSVTVDDGTVTRRYENDENPGGLWITDTWWDLLEPDGDGRLQGAFTVKPAAQPSRRRGCW